MASEWLDLSDMKSWERDHVACENVCAQPDDPDDTLMVALTQKQLALVVFGCILVGRNYRELGPVVGTTIARLHELTDAQEFARGADEDV